MKSVNSESESSPLLGRTGKPSSFHGFLACPLRKWGNYVVQARPGPFHAIVLVPIIIAIGVTLGAINMTREERPENLWLTPDDWVLQDRFYRQT